jgi:hypothetical protein
MTEPALASPRPAAGALRRLGFVPETFVISKDGVIVHKHVGPVSAKDLEETIRPLIERLRR